jgi:hypothetical protein
MKAEDISALYPGTLVEALGAAGCIQALARHLRVPQKQLTSWMEGDEETPRTVLLRALDFVRNH